jgi:hypothetical protein
MRPPSRPIVCAAIVLSGYPITGESTARGQGPGLVGSLGGYGSAARDSMTSMGSTGSSFIPYAGSFGGFMPYRMGGESTLVFRTRGASAIGSSRPAFSLAPMTGGLSSMSARGSVLSPRPRGAMGIGGAMPRSGSVLGSIGVMPPSFGYPFRQPPSLVSPSAAPSMSMP